MTIALSTWCSVRPTEAAGGCENTAVGICSYLTFRGLPPNSVSARAWPNMGEKTDNEVWLVSVAPREGRAVTKISPSCRATGVKLNLLVASPTAKIFSTLVLDHSSTIMAPVFRSSLTPALSKPIPRVLGKRPVAHSKESTSSSSLSLPLLLLVQEKFGICKKMYLTSLLLMCRITWYFVVPVWGTLLLFWIFWKWWFLV